MNHLPIGTILAGTELCAGASRYPQFGKITKVTKTGKYRINFLSNIKIDSEHNKSGVWGSHQVIKPDINNTLADSCLGTVFEGHLMSKNIYWTLYSDSEIYMNVFDNGD